ncbi:outer membrane protein OmpK [Shewanella insulae]|uniref:nucleoside-specific channel-forming Tsx family protein n=1 Tax=Shewanella insulae TaxID=2681496 RepID=UPI001EFE96F3|nr:outer membrane protein OmpK [Shewanella insulae]MCG9754156.1 outer membrane protein OmpK [Shewanella insulae]
MKNVKTLALAATAVAAMSSNAFAADRSDLYATDYKWMQFNAMYSVDEHPIADGVDAHHNYLEMEFGGRKGIVDLYGYVDVFNLGNQDSGDKTNNASKIFMKFAPRFSLDAITGQDLSFGPVQEVYFSTLYNWGGGGITGSYTATDKDFNEFAAYTQGDVNMSFWGLGADVMVPWLGKTGMNLYATYDLNAKDWNGYQFSMNWFKPFHFFENKSFLSFQGYVDWQFAMDEDASGFNTFTGKTNNSSHGGAAFFGLYWHSDKYAVGYGAKYYNKVYGLNNQAFANEFWGGLDTTGWGHYFTATYKF